MQVSSFISVYVEADAGCNDLEFNLGQVGVGASVSTAREFSIKVRNP